MNRSSWSAISKTPTRRPDRARPKSRFGGPGGKKSPPHSGKRDDSKSSFSKGPASSPAASRAARTTGTAPKAPLRQERIAKVMARAGIASRREVERLIGLGKVAVNGTMLDTPATLVTRDDVITVDGKPIGTSARPRGSGATQAGGPGDHPQRPGRAPDRVRRPAARPAAGDLGRTAGPQHRGPAAADQRRRAGPRAGAAHIGSGAPVPRPRPGPHHPGPAGHAEGRRHRRRRSATARSRRPWTRPRRRPPTSTAGRPPICGSASPSPRARTARSARCWSPSA